MYFDKCILCLRDLDETSSPEHIIPEYLGGRLKEVILCLTCNNGIGAKLYAEIKFDAHIRRAVFY
ncbi:MAG: hypothetical protein H0W89_03590 [Candidatus Levybacteria bacterium]|nr:hypothetical protein [Candidatus Levybacteria bacterium]